MISEILGNGKDTEFRNKLGLYPIPNTSVDILLRVGVKQAVVVPQAILGLSYPVHPPSLYLQKHKF